MKDYSALERIKSDNNECIARAFDVGYQQGYEDGYIDDHKDAYQQGLNDAWECVKKLMLPPNEHDGALKGAEIRSIFGTDMYTVLKLVAPSNAIAKIKEHEDEQRCKNCHYPLENPLCGVGNQHCDRKREEIKIGDEILSNWGTKGIVVEVFPQCNGSVTYSVIWHNAESRRWIIDDWEGTEVWKKTGKYFPQIAEIFRREAAISKMTEGIGDKNGR